jgi:large subunit ribosomal protein L1
MSKFLRLLKAILAAKPSGAKGQYVKTITLSATMDPGVRVDVNDALNAAQTTE